MSLALLAPDVLSDLGVLASSSGIAADFLGRADAALVLVVGSLLDTLQQLDGAALLPAMAGLIGLGAVGFPIPEEAVLATGGAVASTGRVDAVLAYSVGWLSVFVFDCALFAVGRRAGQGFAAARAGRFIGTERAERMQELIQRRGMYVTAGARFVMGTRIPVFLLAGAAGLSWRRFAPAVALCGLVSAAVPFLLGFHLAPRLPELIDALGRFGGSVLVGVLSVSVAAFGVFWWRRRRRRAVEMVAVQDETQRGAGS